MNITVLAVGKLKDRFFEEGCAEYSKRLQRYCTLTVRGVLRDAGVPDEGMSIALARRSEPTGIFEVA